MKQLQNLVQQLSSITMICLLSSCGGGGSSGGGSAAPAIAFDSSSTINFYDGGPGSSAIDLVLSNSSNVSNVTATISSSNSSVADVDQTSCTLSGESSTCPIVITQIGQGTAVITASARGYESATVTVNVAANYESYEATTQFAVFNNCPYPVWVQSTNTPSGDDQVQKVVTGGYYNYHVTTQSVASFTAWPKTGCSESGWNCATGDQKAPASSCPSIGCPPPIDSLFEATFNTNGETAYDASLVNGYTLPFNISVVRGAGATNESSCSGADASNLSTESCPTNADLSTPTNQMTFLGGDTFGPYNSYVNGNESTVSLTSVNERAYYPVNGQSVLEGCMAPETVLTYTAAYGGLYLGANESGYAVDYYNPVIMYACPFTNTQLENKSAAGLNHGASTGFNNLSNYCMQTLGQSLCSESGASIICNDGPVNNTQYVQYIHAATQHVYAQTYDDANASLVCSNPSDSTSISHITFTLCPPTN